jgi:nucleoside-diphosphate-sugar epimerase
MTLPPGHTFLILGCGYTGSRVAALLASLGHRVYATSRNPESIAIAGVTPLRPGEIGLLPAGLRVLHSVPLEETPEGLADPTPRLLEMLPPAVARIVYLSTTGVYGAAREVNERTPAAPRTPRETLRVAAESAVLGGPWSAMVLRPAAIYGPGRGAHVSIPAGRFRLAGDGSNQVSRIHVEDLAKLASAALLSGHGGAWPVADRDPSSSRELAAFVCSLLGCPMPHPAPAGELHESRRADRRVDGRAVCRLLGVELRYPSFRQGIPAALAAAGGPDRLQSLS